MSESPTDVVRSMYDAFARADIATILNRIDQEIDWRSPENLPHGGHFNGRDGVAQFFQGIGERWETLTVDVDDVLSDRDRVIALVTARGRLRSASEDTGYTAVHDWTLRDGTPVRFAETVDAPVTLPTAVAAA